MSWIEGWEKDWGDDANYPYDPEQAAIDARRKIVRQQRDAYEETIRAGERERIIKLLEDKAFWLAHLDRLDEVELLRNLVARIKGEQK